MATKPKSSGLLLPMRVWDPATRLFHWAVVIVLAVSYASIRLADGPQAPLWMKIHIVSGETMLTLILFRLAWGVIGSEPARFGRLMQSPKAALRDIATFRQRVPDTNVGHNAASGWMAFVLILLIALLVATGLLSRGEGASNGPLAHVLPRATSDLMSVWHGQISTLLWLAAVVHVAAVGLNGFMRNENPFRLMVTGKKRLPAATRAPCMASSALAVAMLVIAAGATLLICLL